jgi:thiamine biosynthesis lipoprotein
LSDESCADADALCTALMVMGSEEGYSWAVDRSIAARFVVRTDGGFETRSTPRFRDLHGEE